MTAQWLAKNLHVYDMEEIKRRIDKAPHIDLVFDLPKNQSPSRRYRDEPLKVVNTSDTVAYDVTIQPMQSPRYRATFEPISRLEKGQPVYAKLDLRAQPEGTYYSVFEALLLFEREQQNIENADFKVRVPMYVRFYDSTKEICYQTSHEVIYDAFWQDAHIRLVQGTTPITMPWQRAPAAASQQDQGKLVRYIAYGTSQYLRAYEVTIEGSVKYRVERKLPRKEPESLVTTDRDQANIRWHHWYQEWEKQPGSFGGSSGTGLDGKLPW